MDSTKGGFSKVEDGDEYVVDLFNKVNTVALIHEFDAQYVVSHYNNEHSPSLISFGSIIKLRCALGYHTNIG